MKIIIFSIFPILSIILILKGIMMDLQTRWNPAEFVIFTIILIFLLIFINFFIYKNLFSFDKIRKIAIPSVFFVEFIWILYYIFFEWIGDIPVISAEIFYFLFFTIISLIVAESLVFILKKFFKK